MAKIEAQLEGNFHEILQDIETTIVRGSTSASLEDRSDYHTDKVKCAVRVYERYSMMGGNRVSMNITLLYNEGDIFVTVITSGGSQAMFMKINTIGEENFLGTVVQTINKYRK